MRLVFIFAEAYSVVSGILFCLFTPAVILKVAFNRGYHGFRIVRWYLVTSFFWPWIIFSPEGIEFFTKGYKEFFLTKKGNDNNEKN